MSNTLPSVCLDCDAFCETTLVCLPCADVRAERDGVKWIKVLMSQAKELYPEANFDGKKNPTKDRPMTDTQLAREAKAAKRHTSWFDDE